MNAEKQKDEFVQLIQERSNQPSRKGEKKGWDKKEEGQKGEKKTKNASHIPLPH